MSEAVSEAFFRLHEQGLVYRGTRMVNWSPNLQTAVSDLEVEFSEEKGKLYYFKYPVAGGGPDDYLPVATTRPETILGDSAVCVHPEDPRYADYVGKTVVIPMSGGIEIPVIADDYVDREFGTGALKITPAHDPNDYEVCHHYSTHHTPLTRHIYHHYPLRTTTHHYAPLRTTTHHPSRHLPPARQQQHVPPTPLPTAHHPPPPTPPHPIRLAIVLA